MLAIFRRELNAYFKAPLGYIFLAIFFYFSAQFFTAVVLSQSNQIAYIFTSMFTILIFAIPILTMRLMSEEKRQKTDQALLTAPVSLGGIIWGKFLAAFALFGIGMLITVVYFIILSAMSEPQWSLFFGNLLGLILLSGAMISIGLFISSATESQMVAAIGTLAAMFIIFMLDSIAGMMPDALSAVGDVISQLSFMSRYNDFTSGILDISNILFFVSVIVVFNFLSVRILEKKRWS
ncbi:MAG: ABC transporter permease [Massiliimalia sp.]|jgi:ABC-2 type transport system permease protein